MNKFEDSLFPYHKKPPGEKKNKSVEKKEPIEDPGRRNFLKAASILGVGLAMGGYDVFKRLEKGGQEDEATDQEATSAEEADPALIREAEEEHESIKKEDREAINGSSLIEQIKNNNRVTLDAATKKNIFDYWHKSYSPGGKNFSGLLMALERMQPWVRQIKEIFRQNEVPEKYVYISIVESHFSFETFSRKLAKGPFQFMEETGKNYSLKINATIDERCDPLKSAQACARHLRDSYERLNNDWSLALADYNGSYSNRYAAKRGNRSERNYQDYLKYREAGLNEFLARPFYEHIVADKESLGLVAASYGISVEELKKINKLPGDKIKKGQALKLPPTSAIKLRKLQDALENLNYPEKLFAVIDVIEKNGLEKKYASKPAKFDLAEVPRTSTKTYAHAVAKGEGTFVIARKFKSLAEKNGIQKFSLGQIEALVLKQNKISDPKKIRIGQVLQLELPLEGPMSLAQIAVKRAIPKEKLISLNPAVINPNSPLPQGFQVRIPKAGLS